MALLVLAAVVIVTSLGESLEHVRYGSALMAATLVLLLLRNVRPPAASVVAFAPGVPQGWVGSCCRYPSAMLPPGSSTRSGTKTRSTSCCSSRRRRRGCGS